MPAVSYPLTIKHPAPAEMLTLNLIIRRMGRKSILLKKRFPRAFIHSDMGLGLPSLSEHLVVQNLSNLVCAIQPSCPYRDTTLAHLRLLQSTIHSPELPFSFCLRVEPKICMHPLVHLMNTAADLGISIPALHSGQQATHTPVIWQVTGAAALGTANLIRTLQIVQPKYLVTSQDIMWAAAHTLTTCPPAILIK